MTSQNIKDEFIYVSQKTKSRQHKTKIDIDEFKSGTTYITLFYLKSDFDKTEFHSTRARLILGVSKKRFYGDSMKKLS
jgi:hypothetical protein